MSAGAHRRPRVLLYSATPRSDRGGVQRMLDDLMAALPAHGLDVRRAGPDESVASGGLHFTAATAATAAGRPRLGALPAAAGSLLRLCALLREVRPDVVNIHFVTGEAAYFLLLRRVFGYRVVLSAHGGDLLRPTREIRRHLPWMLRSADRVTAVSRELERAASVAAGDLGERLRYIPNGVDTAFWHPSGEAPVAGRIAAAGRLLPIKGFDLLVAAMGGLPGATLQILGEGTERPALQAAIERAGLRGRIELLGHVPPERMRRAFREAELFAMPSRGEGMPLALLEALATGRPAVAAAVGAIPELLVGAAGRVVPPEDPEALRAALAEALSGRAALSGEAAREVAERHGYDVCYGRYADELRALAGVGR